MPVTHENEGLTGRVGRHTDSTDPDSIMQSDLPQIPIDHWDAEKGQILGRCEGPLLDSEHETLETFTGNETTFSRPHQTRFVRIQRPDGSEQMEPYNPVIHGEWDAIPDTGLTPTQLQQQLEGFGTELKDQSQQFRNTRKEGSTFRPWPSDHHPKPKKGL